MSINKVSLTTFLAACAVCISFAAPAVHADGAGEIKYRKTVMKAVGGHMGALVGIVKGETANTDDMLAHAKSMHALAKIAQGVFPKGSDSFAAETEAKMKIWDEPAAFEKVTKAFVTESENVVKAAETGDRGKLAEAVSALGKNACKACHDDFREKDK